MYSSTITIAVLDSTASPTGQVLTLSGPGLPLMGAEWAMENHLVTTWYPGNSEEATQQMLGPAELPSHWSGDWRRTMLGSSPQTYVDDHGQSFTIIDPLSLWNAMEQIARGGQRLSVVWSVTPDNGDPSATGMVTREGRFKTLRFKPARVQDIVWEVEFHWMSRGGVTPKVTSLRADTVASNSAAYQNALNALVSANQQSEIDAFNPTTSSLGQLEAVSALPTGLVAGLSVTVSAASFDVSTSISIAATLSSQPVAVANNAVTLAQDSVDQSNTFYDQVSEVPYELMTENNYELASFLFSFGTFAPQSDAAQALAVAGQKYAATLRQQVQALRGNGIVDPKQLGDPNNVLDTYVTVDGDTPDAISARFYNGSPDHAVDILIANDFPWYQPSFPSGIILVIPRVSTTNPTQAV